MLLECYSVCTVKLTTVLIGRVRSQGLLSEGAQATPH